MKKFVWLVTTAMALITQPALARGSHASSHSSSHATSHARVSSHHVNSSSTSVHGYTRRNGTHVNGYHRTKANHTKLDNYSTRGNINPYTGKSGTVDPNK